MPVLVLQGPHLTNAAAEHLSRSLGGTLQYRAHFAHIEVQTSPSSDELAQWRYRYPFDVNLIPPQFTPERAALLVTDMDSTLINIECIDEIAGFLGIKSEVAAVTEAAMRGELDFEASLVRRVALLRDLDISALERVYQERLRLNPGADIMLAGLKSRGIRVALVSGGFTYFTQRLQQRLGLDFTLANELEIVNGKLTGRVLGEIVGADGKAAFLQKLCTELGLERSQTLAMGDGANDLKMMRLAGLDIAYHGKPVVQAQASAVINHCGLEGVLGLLGIEW